MVSRHIKTSHFPCRRWISQAPPRDTSGFTKPAAIPHVDAEFHKHSFETHIRGIIVFYGNALLHAGSMRSSHPLVLKLGLPKPLLSTKSNAFFFFIHP